ncbi:hypothetical protein [Streptomyces sp. NBC_01233]|uniref:hypothetical protein n=1 Tax=Streptomyces sp. NBC_01233 TaxID=2903787 RepID=UPI002E135C37|nr:hypothetical protein OG332_00385 [Streptomyces sp. NBC_01233]WSP95284.1 hypothetical protein OG332_46600 [Streptomyces sp. NBC_01233]
MGRADLLSNLAASGTDTTPETLAELATELDVPPADLLVIAGHPVPAELLPPKRDATITEQFAYRVSHCDHAQLASLEDFVRSLPHLDAPGPFVEPTSPYPTPAESGPAAVFNGLLRNRGFGIKELPFAGLSRSTLRAMVSDWGPTPHRRYQLCAIAGPLGWRLPDLFAVVGEPYSPDFRPAHLCRHVGRVFTAAVPLSTTQLIECAQEADRLSARENHGVWHPVSQGSVAECPDHP